MRPMVAYEVNPVSIPPSNSLFVGDLPKFCTERDLEELFTPFGPILDVHLKRNAAVPYGFLTLSSLAAAEAAIHSMNGMFYMGRHIRVYWATNNARQSAVAHGASINSVYVRYSTSRIENKLSEYDLHRLFSMHGNVEEVSIKDCHVDQRTGKICGYAFVHYSSSEDGVQAAFQAVAALDNATIDGITYSVEVSRNLLKQFHKSKMGELGAMNAARKGFPPHRDPYGPPHYDDMAPTPRPSPAAAYPAYPRPGMGNYPPMPPMRDLYGAPAGFETSRPPFSSPYAPQLPYAAPYPDVIVYPNAPRESLRPGVIASYPDDVQFSGQAYRALTGGSAYDFALPSPYQAAGRRSPPMQPESLDGRGGDIRSVYSYGSEDRSRQSLPSVLSSERLGATDLSVQSNQSNATDLASYKRSWSNEGTYQTTGGNFEPYKSSTGGLGSSSLHLDTARGVGPMHRNSSDESSKYFAYDKIKSTIYDDTETISYFDSASHAPQPRDPSPHPQSDKRSPGDGAPSLHILPPVANNKALASLVDHSDPCPIEEEVLDAFNHLTFSSL